MFYVVQYEYGAEFCITMKHTALFSVCGDAMD